MLLQPGCTVVLRRKPAKPESVSENESGDAKILTQTYRENGLILERNIFCEKKNGSALVCLSGIGNTKENYAALAQALREIAQG